MFRLLYKAIFRLQLKKRGSPETVASIKYEISLTLEYYIIISHILKIRDLVYIRIYFYISFLYLIFLKYEISLTLEYDILYLIFHLISLKYEISLTLEYDIFITHILKIRDLVNIRI